MHRSSYLGKLAGCLGLFVLLTASAYAVDPPNPEHKDLPAITVTAEQDPIDAMKYLGALTHIVVNDLVGKHAYLFITNSSTSSNNPADNPSGCSGYVGRPIDVSKGTKLETYPIFALPGEMGLTFVLYYNTSLHTGPWSTNLQYSLDLLCTFSSPDPSICKQVMYYRPDGSTLLFNGKPGVGPFTESGGGGLATLTYDTSSATYTLHDEDASTKIFDTNGLVRSTIDTSGIGWTIGMTQANGITTYTVTHTNGRSYTVAYGPVTSQLINGHTVTDIPVNVTDPAGNVYALDSGPANFNSISFPGSPATVISFKYASTQFSKLAEVDYNGTPYDYTTYVMTSTDPHYGWANGNYLSDNSEGVFINYATDSAGNVEATLTNSLGHQSTQTYDGTNGGGGAYNGYLSLISDTAVTTCGTTVHGRSYDANGHLSETIDNNGNAHTYTYAVNGQLQSETEGYGTSLARTTDYVWDPNQQLNRLLSETVEGWTKTTYTYNAQNRLASVSVTNLSGTGSANQTLTTTYGYTLYGNGIVQTMTVTRPSPSGTGTDTYTYDAFGDLTSLANGLGQTTTYGNYNALGEVGHVVGPNGDATDYTYDPRGRVATKTTYPNGAAATWTYAYDGFGQLYTLTSPDGQITTWNRDPSTMRLTSTTHNDKDGASTESFSYDANGDVLQHTIARGSVVGLSETYHYDTLGRVYQKIGQNGQSLTYAYDGNGNTLSIANAVGHTITNQFDALNRVTQTSESGGASPPMPSTAPTINAPSNNATGSYTVSWTSVTGATTYPLQEQVNGESWNTIQNNSGISWATSGKANATYGYRVQGCNVTGCGPWSNVGATTVLYPPGTPALSVPTTSSTGSYTASWSSVGTATSYNLQEQVNGGAWTTVQSSGATSWSATGKTNSTYSYQVQACNGSGCSAWSAVSSIAVLLPPGGAPTLTAPSSNANGSYTVSWTSVATATSYTLQQQVNGGSWTTAQSTSAISWSASGESNGTYAYRVAACNAAGCSAWSSTSTTTVLLPPGSPPSVSSPGNNSTGSYTVSWSTITNATSYTLQEQVNGGAWITVQSGSATTWSAAGKANGTYGYQAQSCNSGGCSAWSSVSTTTVLHPPGSAPALTVPGSSTTGSYTVSWTGVSTATSYTLQERLNGGGWTTVQTAGTTSWAANGHGNGTYGYQVQACNASGCGPWSSVGSTTVLLPPGSAPSLSVPGSNGTGSYTVSWTDVSTATSYNLQEQINGGGWITVQSSNSTSWSTSGRGNGTYGYQVKACNASGCGPWSGVGNTTVLLPPGSAPSLSVPARNYTGSYTVTWGSVSTASSYTLQEQVNGGGWSTVQANSASSWSASGHANGTYGYRVMACNASGCGPWSGIGSVAIIIPAPIAMNGQTYSGTRYGSSGTGNEGIGFDIINGNTWEVYKTQVGNPHVVVASGAVPPGASTVQYAWNDAGVPTGDLNAGGSITNPASSPVSVSSNPSTLYTTGTFSLASGDHGHQYNLRVDFYDVASGNVSSSTCLLIAEVSSTN
jgi:YD repeat-containing protein